MTRAGVERRGMGKHIEWEKRERERKDESEIAFKFNNYERVEKERGKVI